MYLDASCCKEACSQIIYLIKAKHDKDGRT